jgi:hypothetical protein
MRARINISLAIFTHQAAITLNAVRDGAQLEHQSAIAGLGLYFIRQRHHP